MNQHTQPPATLLAWVEHFVEPIDFVQDASMPRSNSRVWRITSGRRSVFLKISPTPSFFARETRAYRSCVPALEPRQAPRLLASRPTHLALLLTQVPGEPIKTLPRIPSTHGAIHRQAGAWLRKFHGEQELVRDERGEALAELARAAQGAERHLQDAGTLLTEPEYKLVRLHAEALNELGPLPLGFVHGDFQERNWLWHTDARRLGVIDYERSRPYVQVYDFIKLAGGPWADDPALRNAFFEGFGRDLTFDEHQALRCLGALDAASAIAWGSAHGDHTIVERGHRTLARLTAGEEL
ncbi:aminoglycoside phosphotransferase family protein [Streptomyces sp. NBC_01465]|uniref:aminoglycoside phosphotransferase family protein n=1 Tax=Streptomyces sp. NBC_01465 TaxID=2903878 RepID=UPI002E329BA9|nr:aminoglycoside phosphotransferase family protein [Streptomyces sp. NBC_01465]